MTFVSALRTGALVAAIILLQSSDPTPFLAGIFCAAAYRAMARLEYEDKKTAPGHGRREDP